jgi:hypothetical protein
MATIGEVNEALEGLNTVKEAHSVPMSQYMSNIKLMPKNKCVEVTLRLPLDALKRPDDVREFDGTPIVSFLTFNED